MNAASPRTVPAAQGTSGSEAPLEDPSARGQLYPRRAAPIPCPPPPTLPDRGDGHTGHGAAACTYAQHPRPSGTCAAASGSGRVRAGGWSSAQDQARGRPGRCRRPGILSHIWTRDPTCHFALGPARYAAGLVTDPPPHPASLHRAPLPPPAPPAPDCVPGQVSSSVTGTSPWRFRGSVGTRVLRAACSQHALAGGSDGGLSRSLLRQDTQTGDIGTSWRPGLGTGSLASQQPERPAPPGRGRGHPLSAAPPWPAPVAASEGPAVPSASVWDPVASVARSRTHRSPRPPRRALCLRCPA